MQESTFNGKSDGNGTKKQKKQDYYLNVFITINMIRNEFLNNIQLLSLYNIRHQQSIC